MKIGIFWFHEDNVIGISHEFKKIHPDSIGMIDSPFEHFYYWKKLQQDLPKLRDIEYDEIPRGKAIYDSNRRKLVIYLDKKLLITYREVKICNFFNAIYKRETIFRLHPHYRTYNN